ncbi:hypothetical protein MNBD_NITROSPINAE01-976, partial [hydrothermal vent metagenome]
PHPLHILAKILGLIFVTETIIMMFLSSFTMPGTPFTWVADALILTVAITPAIYFMVIRPLLRHMEERERLEDASRRAREQAESASKLKDKFVSLVSHDLRTPLASIIGLLRILNADSVHPLNEDQKALLEHVTRAGDDLVNMIDKLLDIGKLQAGMIQPHFKFTDARELAIKCVAQVSHLAMAKGVNLRNEVPEGIKVYADPDLLGEVMNNILLNAVKFSGKGDSVTAYIPEGRPNIIAVCDTGVGIPEDIVPRLFKHYDKTSTLGTEGEEGSGLGLPLCYDIMAAHNGSLTVKSEVGKGTEFFIRTPAIRPLILVVEPDAESRMTLSSQLKEFNADIIETESGEEALAILEETRPHLIIMDANTKTPRSNENLIQKLKSAKETMDLPIIAITAEGEEARHADLNLSKERVTEDILKVAKPFI